MSLLLDELLVPALGLSAPSRDYPLFTRARGFVAHLVYGAVVALAAEGLGRLMQPARALSWTIRRDDRSLETSARG